MFLGIEREIQASESFWSCKGLHGTVLLGSCQFINKLAVCSQRQNNLLSNPTILSVPDCLPISVHHELEKKEES